MKVAFYLPNKNISTIDFSTVDKGNPGVGGSEFSVILIASNLCNRCNIEVMLYCDKLSQFPRNLRYKVCNNLVGAIKLSVEQAVDFLIVDSKWLTKDILCRFTQVKFIAWANTFIPIEFQNFFAKMGNVVKVINVGKEELEQTKGHYIYNKSTYIYNAVPTEILKSFPSITPNKGRKHNVCYIGSLHPAKGFQYLAKSWPKVLAEIPDAQLFVIGSGKLYGRNARLGKFNIADEKFEEEFMPYISKNGKIIDSVHFLGILGQEKYNVMEKCKVGVPNPSGVSETFGYTAVEMQFMDCQVTTIKCPGYLDTVCCKENLYATIDDLPSYIIKLLKNDLYDNKPVLDYIQEFSINRVVEKWESFLRQTYYEHDKIEIVKDWAFYINLLRFYIKDIKTKIKALLRK